MHPDQVEQVTFEAFGDQCIQHTMRAVFTAYDTATQAATSLYQPQERPNVLPWMRRGKIEEGVRAAGERNGHTCETIINDGGWRCTEVRSGNVVLAQALVPYPCGPIQESRYRKTMARANPTFWDDAIDDGEELFALLVHSTYKSNDPSEWSKYSHLPGSIYLAWPDAELGYVISVNLFERYPHIIETHTPREWDTEARVQFVHRSARGYGS